MYSICPVWVEKTSALISKSRDFYVCAKLFCAVAVCALQMLAPARAEDSRDFSELVRLLTVSNGITVDEISDYLALGRTPNSASKRLVRWDQAEITIGVIASENVPSSVVTEVTDTIKRTFKYVGRQLRGCLRNWPVKPEGPSDSHEISGCGLQLTQIDLVIDAANRTIFANMDPSKLPSDSTQDFLKAIWADVRQTAIAQPSARFCNGAVATDVSAYKLVGGAAVIRQPIAEGDSFASVMQCSKQLAYYLLGSVPIMSKSEEQTGMLNPNLLVLLYRNEFRSGESQDEILAKLREVASKN